MIISYATLYFQYSEEPHRFFYAKNASRYIDFTDKYLSGSHLLAHNRFVVKEYLQDSVMKFYEAPPKNRERDLRREAPRYTRFPFATRDLISGIDFQIFLYGNPK